MINNNLFLQETYTAQPPNFFFFSFSEHSFEISQILGKEFFRNTLFIDTLEPIYRR